MKKVQILGLFHSGTNLLINMIQNNCGVIDDPQNVVDVSENMFCWKHTLRELLINETIKQNPDHLFIIIYKNVYNWMFSVAIDPIDLKFEKGIFGKCRLLNLEFDNIVDFHNRYNQMYKRLLTKFPQQVVLLDYYKLIQKENVLDYLKPKLATLGLYLKDEQSVLAKLDRPSKTTGVRNSQEAINKYDLIQQTMKATLVSYPDILEHHLNTDLMTYFESL